MLRDYTCNDLNTNHINQFVTLCGWINKVRILPKIIFVDLKDRYGITQLIFSDKIDKKLYVIIRHLNLESVIKIYGKVIERKNKNYKINTGLIEIIVYKLDIINKSLIFPFELDNYSDNNDDLRFKYRYLDLKSNYLYNNIYTRHEIYHIIRNFFYKNNFIEIETPYLIKSIPEGARNFIIPSRIYKNEFYALPQSPQILKQLLMISGYDKYYQIVKCFRDEDLRSDRQLEFTQLDCEMSFIEENDIMKLIELLIFNIFDYTKSYKINKFYHMTYDDAIKYYGTDKPDLRFDMNFIYFNKILNNNNGYYIGFRIDNIINSISEDKLKNIILWIKKFISNEYNLIYIKYDFDKNLYKAVNFDINNIILEKCIHISNMNKNDILIILFSNNNINIIRKTLSVIRIKIGNIMELNNNNIFKAVWITDFPLFKWNNNKWESVHHMFTAPKMSDINKLYVKSEICNIKSRAYDIVINGIEIGGGSIRIHHKNIQKKILEILAIDDKIVNNNFKFMLDALDYGAPPHGGIALGIDRLCALIAGCNSIKDVIAFPKTNAAKDLMMKSPDLLI